MKSVLLAVLHLLIAGSISAQLVISDGGQLSVSGDIQVSLNNTQLINHGNFSAGNSLFRFSGNATTTIGGTQPIRFYGIEIDKTNNHAVDLQRSIGVQQRLLFTTGLVNLNGFNIDFGNSGILDGEKADSRVIGNNGGQLICSTQLNAPSNVNPGNLGAIISSSQNLGATVIRRGHQSQVVPGVGMIVNRYYDIVPVNNTNLQATLRFTYFDTELNGNNEGTLLLVKSDNNVNWTIQGFSSRSASTNYVEKTGVASFARWSLTSSAAGPLPVQFSLFNLRCEGAKVVLVWKTEQEQNSQYFEIQKSVDGVQWTAAGTISAAGNSSTERSYAYTDNAPSPNSYYRVAQYDIDGRKQYTSVLRSDCGAADLITIWPNPVRDNVSVSITAGVASSGSIKLFDSKGALVKMQKIVLLHGANQYTLDIPSLAKGVYTLQAEWNNGQLRKTIQLLKQ